MHISDLALKTVVHYFNSILVTKMQILPYTQNSTQEANWDSTAHTLHRLDRAVA